MRKHPKALPEKVEAKQLASETYVTGKQKHPIIIFKHSKNHVCILGLGVCPYIENRIMYYVCLQSVNQTAYYGSCHKTYLEGMKKHTQEQCGIRSHTRDVYIGICPIKMATAILMY